MSEVRRSASVGNYSNAPLSDQPEGLTPLEQGIDSLSRNLESVPEGIGQITKVLSTTLKSELENYFKDTGSQTTVRTDVIAKLVIGGNLESIDRVFDLIQYLDLMPRQKQDLSAKILDIVSEHLPPSVMETTQFNAMNAKWALLAIGDDKDSGISSRPSTPLSRTSSSDSMEMKREPVPRPDKVSSHASKIFNSINKLKKDDLSEVIKEIQKCPVREQLWLASELSAKVNLMNLSAKISKQELIKLPQVVTNQESLLKELKSALKKGDTLFCRELIKELSLHAEVSSLSSKAKIEFSKRLSEHLHNEIKNGDIEPALHGLQILLQNIQDPESIAKILAPVLAMIKQELGKNSEVNREGLEKGISFIENQIKTESSEERAVILRSVVELAYDLKHGTNHYDMNSQIGLSGNLLRFSDRFLMAKDMMKDFWIHTSEDMIKAQFHVGLLANLLGKESVQVPSQENSRIISESKEGTIIRLPQDEIFSMIGRQKDSQAENFHQSGRFIEDVKRMTILLPGRTEPLVKPQDLSDIDWANHVHEILKQLSPNDHVNIEKSLVQTTQTSSLFYLTKHLLPVQAKNPGNPVAPLTQFSRQELPNIRIEQRGDKLFVINTKAFLVAMEDESEDMVKNIVYTENVYVTNQAGQGSLYFLDYALRDPPKELAASTMEEKQKLTSSPQPALTSLIQKATKSPTSLLSQLQKL